MVTSDPSPSPPPPLNITTFSAPPPAAVLAPPPLGASSPSPPASSGSTGVDSYGAGVALDVTLIADQTDELLRGSVLLARITQPNGIALLVCGALLLLWLVLRRVGAPVSWQIFRLFDFCF